MSLGYYVMIASGSGSIFTDFPVSLFSLRSEWRLGWLTEESPTVQPEELTG